MNRRRFALLVLICLVGASALFFGAGAILSRPASRPVGPPPVDFPAQTVRIPMPPGQFVVGWFAPGHATRGMVLLLHGVRADRRQMLGRAGSLNRLGYAALLIDLPAHGESSGERITFGAQEAAGVTAAVGFLRGKLPGERLGIIGVSPGAAATVLANLRPAPNAVVLESMYPTIEEAVAGRLRMRLGPAGTSLAPFLLWQLPLWTGISAQDLRPIRLLEDLGAPCWWPLEPRTGTRRGPRRGFCFSPPNTPRNSGESMAQRTSTCTTSSQTSMNAGSSDFWQDTCAMGPDSDFSPTSARISVRHGPLGRGARFSCRG